MTESPQFLGALLGALFGSCGSLAIWYIDRIYERNQKKIRDRNVSKNFRILSWESARQLLREARHITSLSNDVIVEIAATESSTVSPASIQHVSARLRRGRIDVPLAMILSELHAKHFSSSEIQLLHNAVTASRRVNDLLTEASETANTTLGTGALADLLDEVLSANARCLDALQTLIGAIAPTGGSVEALSRMQNGGSSIGRNA